MFRSVSSHFKPTGAARGRSYFAITDTSRLPITPPATFIISVLPLAALPIGLLLLMLFSCWLLMLFRCWLLMLGSRWLLLMLLSRWLLLLLLLLLLLFLDRKSVV